MLVKNYAATVFFLLSLGLHFSLARLGLWVAYPEVFSVLNFHQTVQGFIYGLRFDFSIIAIFSTPFLLLWHLPSIRFWGEKTQKWIVRIVSIALLGVFCGLNLGLIGNHVYFQETNRHATTELLFIVNETKYLLSVLGATGLLGLCAFFFYCGGWFWVWRKLWQHSFTAGSKDWLALAVLGVILMIFARGGIQQLPIQIVDAYRFGNAQVGLLSLNGVFTTGHSLVKQSWPDTEFYTTSVLANNLNLTEDQLKKPYPLAKTVERDPQKQGRNLFVVFVEGLSNQYVDSFGQQNYQLTPNLDRLASQGLVFPNFFSHGQRSIHALQAVLGGLPNLPGSTNLVQGQVANFSKLAEIAKLNDYRAFFISSLEREAFRTDSIAGALGFDEYYSQEQIPKKLVYPEQITEKLGWDYETLLQSLEIANQHPEKLAATPFVAAIFISTDHVPYPKLPPPFNQQPHSPEGKTGYMNALTYTDWAIGEFIKQAQQHTFFADSIFVFFGDHINPHTATPDFHNRFQVPLIIYAPKWVQPGTNPVVGSHLDLLPTFIDLLGLKATYTSLGESLLSKTDSWALSSTDLFVGIITDQAYLTHSLKNRLDAVKISQPGIRPKNLNPEVYFDRLEKRLLAIHQLSYQLFKENRWAPPAPKTDF